MLIHSHEAQSAVWYINANAKGANTGGSWADAYTDLQSALALTSAQWGDEIWVAKGTYKPTTGTDQTKSFVMPSGVAIYGGFAGDETTSTQRNWTINTTILSGNLGMQKNTTIRANYVVTGGNQAILDGLTISGGSSGMFNDSVSPIIVNCTFANNTSINYSFGAGIYNNNASPKITNCTFCGNLAGVGGGMYNQYESAPTLNNCIFIGNIATDVGGGMHSYCSSPTLTNCIFTSNTASGEHGGGMFNCNGSSTIINCTFTGNKAEEMGGGMYNNGASPIVTDCVFAGNTASDGGGISNEDGSSILTNCIFTGNMVQDEGGGMRIDGATTMTNCTFIGNTADSGGGIYNNNFYSYYKLAVINCILWDNSANCGSEIYTNSCIITDINHCDIQGCGGSGVLWNSALGFDGGENIMSNPQFENVDDPAGPDGTWRTQDDGLTLQPTSPCIHAGTAVGAPLLDILGNSRQGQPDMGAYQYISIMQPTPTPIPVIKNVVIYVNVNADGAANGSSWANAFTDLQNALKIANWGDEIWVAAGTYKPTSGTDKTKSFAMTEGVAIYGGFAGSESTREERNWKTHATILSGNLFTSGKTVVNAYCVIYGGYQTILDGLTISGGYSGMVNDSVSPAIVNCIFTGNAPGWGMENFNASTMVTNCIFTNNSWGGMYNSVSTPTVNNCTFSGNNGGICNQSESSPMVINCNFTGNVSSSDGGGINGGSPTVTNCIFTGNVANFQGGAMYIEYPSSSTVTNCIFSSNSANEGGGICNAGFLTEIACAFTGNTAYDGGGIYIKNGSSTVTNCTFTSNTASDKGGAIYNNNYTTPTLTNCILWGDKSIQNPEVYNDISYIKIQNSTFCHCDIQESGGSGISWNSAFGIDNGGNIDNNPQFVNATNPIGPDALWFTSDDGLALQYTSPCIYAGISIGASSTDILGKSWIGVPDIGAYQYYPPSALPTPTPTQKSAAVEWIFYR